jgi:bacteriophage N4 adsorption protein B
VQIPVEPILTRNTTIIAAHYADEFAEAHGKEMPLRAALASGLPAAGVGCAFARSALVLLAMNRADGPFHAESLTEDYELGITLGAAGLACRFVEAVDERGDRIAVRSEFPATIEACVRQKSRWIAGIAFAGWDRLNWAGDGQARGLPAHAAGWRGWGLRWMLWRDRRAPLAACVILCAYLGMILAGIDQGAAIMGWWSAMAIDNTLRLAVITNSALMAWRLGMRMIFTGTIYGLKQAVLAIPRAFVGNIIHILAARRAFALYLQQLRTRELVWDKTEHRPLPGPAPVRNVQ